jgi:hypothetical protein
MMKIDDDRDDDYPGPDCLIAPSCLVERPASRYRSCEAIVHALIGETRLIFPVHALEEEWHLARAEHFMNKEFNRGWARMNADGSGLLFFGAR